MRAQQSSKLLGDERWDREMRCISLAQLGSVHADLLQSDTRKDFAHIVRMEWTLINDGAAPDGGARIVFHLSKSDVGLAV
eukprot:SAG31_NODE_20003_length_586_cov_1.507187_1_plen_80_part_00